MPHSKLTTVHLSTDRKHTCEQCNEPREEQADNVAPQKHTSMQGTRVSKLQPGI
eukprot:m.27533 g.27533  ORF g.27533 m.27533 type:complete len:54 (-) comp6442_c0_seq2:300-461(-)